MKTISKLLSIILFLVISATSQAQDFVKRGTTELGGSLLFAHQNASYSNAFGSASSSATTLIISPYFGFMFNSGFELGVVPEFIFLASDGTDGKGVNLFLAPAFNIRTKGNAYPFIEFLLGFNNAESKTGVGYGMNVGVKSNVAGNSLLLTQLQFLVQNLSGGGISSLSNNDSNLTLITFSFCMGYRIFIRPNEKKK